MCSHRDKLRFEHYNVEARENIHDSALKKGTDQPAMDDQLICPFFVYMQIIGFLMTMVINVGRELDS